MYWRVSGTLSWLPVYVHSNCPAYLDAFRPQCALRYLVLIFGHVVFEEALNHSFQNNNNNNNKPPTTRPDHPDIKLTSVVISKSLGNEVPQGKKIKNIKITTDWSWI